MGSLRIMRAIERPSLKRLGVRASGSTLFWDPRFRDTMCDLCEDRGLPHEVPDAVQVSVIAAQGLMLVWPCRADEPDSHPVHISSQGRRIRTSLVEPFASLHISLPYGITIAIPVTRFLSPRHGRCLALHFNHAEFLYKRSRPSAIGLQRDDV